MIILNMAAFQVGWFACVLGAARGLYFLGPVVVCGLFILHLFLHRNIAREITIGCMFMICGFFTDTLLTVSNVYTPLDNISPYPFSPPWLIFMWLNFSTVFNVSLKWMQKKYFLSVLLGGVGGGLSYYGGASLGAIDIADPVLGKILLTGLVWAGLTPALFILVEKTNKRFAK